MSCKDDQHEKVARNSTSDAEDSSFITPQYMSSVIRRQLLREMVKSLPKAVQGRVTAMKNVQLEQLKLETAFFDEVYQLEVKYQSLYEPLNNKRREIVNGNYEPTEEETKWKGAESVQNEEEELNNKLQDVQIENRFSFKFDYPEDVKGVPNFWLSIFKCCDILSSMVQKDDEPVLKQLTDITITYEDDPMSYILEFHFAPNEYFTNTVLTKQYYLKVKVEEDNPFSFEGPEIYKCTGCVINWNKEKNLTVKTIRKKQKHKARGAVRTITKQVPTDSFFNFFNPPVVQDENNMDIDTQSILSTDFEVGHFLRSRIIPKAVLFFTGDMVDEEDDDFDEEEEEEEEENEYEEDTDEDARNARKGKKKPSPVECPQQ